MNGCARTYFRTLWHYCNPEKLYGVGSREEPRAVSRIKFLLRPPAQTGIHLWSWRRDLNPRPSDYKSDALPAELRQHNWNGLDVRNDKGTLRKLPSVRDKDKRLAHQQFASQPSRIPRLATNGETTPKTPRALKFQTGIVLAASLAHSRSTGTLFGILTGAPPMTGML